MERVRTVVPKGHRMYSTTAEVVLTILNGRLVNESRVEYTKWRLEQN